LGLTIEVRMQNANLSQEIPQEQGSRTIPDTPSQRSAELGFAPAGIIERAAQHLDWTIAFGMRHNTPRGFEGNTNELAQPDPLRVPGTSRLRFGRIGLTRLPLISRLCFVSVLAAGAVGAGIFILTQPAREKTTVESAPAEEALPKVSEAASSSEGLAMSRPTAGAVENAALAGPAPTPAESGAEPAPAVTPTGGPEPKVAVTPAAPTLEAASTIAPPAPQKTPTLPSLSAAEIAGLLARGDWWFATGDVSSARLFYERAAVAGEARAAEKLGETFDPAFLGRPNLRGVRADPGMAVFWYRRARDLGATDTASRLIGLETKQEAWR
jgi:hypothetical protein